MYRNLEDISACVDANASASLLRCCLLLLVRSAWLYVDRVIALAVGFCLSYLMLGPDKIKPTCIVDFIIFEGFNTKLLLDTLMS